MFALFADYARTWEVFLVFFLVVFVATWAGGVWITPFGPVILNLSVFPFVVTGLLIALLLMVFISMEPPGNTYGSSAVREETIEESNFLLSVGWLFWLTILCFGLVIIVKYVA
jgi:hypothetical protein